MSAPTPTLVAAACSETGAVRVSNEDAAHAGPRLLAVAYGVGGPGGAAASAAAVDALRHLVCSDGLSAVVARAALLDALTGAAGPEEAVQRLTAPAAAEGSPDNVSCVVADVVACAE